MVKPKQTASVVVPNWNGINLLETSLSSLIKQTFIKREIILVDNGSTDGSVEYVRKNFPEVKVIALDKNYGFAKAVNMGIKASKGKYIILINNDTETEKNCIKYLVEAADKHLNVGFVAAKILNFYNRDTIDSVGDYIDEVGHANNFGLGEKDGPKFNREGYIFLATGGGALFKRDIFDKVGLLDEKYFAYFEDVDLCLRAQLLGFKGWYEPKALIYHIHKATSSKNPALLEYLQFRNLTLTIIKDFPSEVIFKKWRWLKIVLVHFNTIFYQLKNGFWWPPFLADLWILSRLPLLIIDRIGIQSNMKVSPEYIESFLVEKKITFWGLRR